MRNLFALLAILMIVAGCNSSAGITKRKYRNGYYINLKSTKEELKHSISTAKQTTKLAGDTAKANPNDVYIILNNGDTLEARLEAIYEDEISYRKLTNLTGPIYRKELSAMKKVVSKSGMVLHGEEDDENSPNQAPQDWKIITSKGDTIPAIIKSANKDEVQYKKASNPDGPSYIKETSSLSKILDENGNEAYSEFVGKSEPTQSGWQTTTTENESDGNYWEETSSDTDKEEKIASPPPQKKNRDAIVSFIFACISLLMLILAIIGFSLGYYYLAVLGGWEAEFFGILAVFAGAVASIQAFAAGIIAFVTGLVSTLQINKKNSKYKKDWKSIFGLAVGALYVLALLAGIIGIEILSSI